MRGAPTKPLQFSGAEATARWLASMPARPRLRAVRDTASLAVTQRLSTTGGGL